MYSIEKTFHFSAAHHLEWVPSDHPCFRVHGHNYSVTLRYEADMLDEHGFVIDTHKLVPFKQYLDQQCEHRDLNASLPALEDQTTGERLALHFADIVRSVVRVKDTSRHTELVSVTVCETDSVCAAWWV